MERPASARPSRWAWVALGACLVASVAQVPLELDHGETAQLPALTAPALPSTAAPPNDALSSTISRPLPAPALAPAGNGAPADSGPVAALTRLVVGTLASTDRRSTPATPRSAAVKPRVVA